MRESNRVEGKSAIFLNESKRYARKYLDWTCQLHIDHPSLAAMCLYVYRLQRINVDTLKGKFKISTSLRQRDLIRYRYLRLRLAGQFSETLLCDSDLRSVP